MDELLRVTLEYVLASETTRSVAVRNAMKPKLSSADIQETQEARAKEEALRNQLDAIYAQRITKDSA